MRIVNISCLTILLVLPGHLFWASTSLAATAKLDYDNDGRSDLIIRRPLEFTQIINRSSDAEIQNIVFGRNTRDIPIHGDFDGDGITDIGVRRPSNQTWYILNSSGEDKISDRDDGITRLKFGSRTGDIPVPADYDGDGVTDIAVRRPSTQFWYIRNSSGVDSITQNSDGITRLRFGLQSTDIPVVADYDGDGKADIAVRRPANQTWYIKNSSGVDAISGKSDGITRYVFGRRTEDIPVPADYDGDGRADIAVRRPSSQVWYILNSNGEDLVTNKNDGITRKRFGSEASDIPVVADYDGDNIDDIAVFRPNTGQWFILNSNGEDPVLGADDGISRVSMEAQRWDIPLAQPVQLTWANRNILEQDCDSVLKPAIPAQTGCDGLFLTDPQNIERTVGLPTTIEFGRKTGLTMADGEWFEIDDDNTCLNLGANDNDFALSFWFRTTLEPGTEFALGQPLIIGSANPFEEDGFAVFSRLDYQNRLLLQVTSRGYLEGELIEIEQGQWSHIAINYRNDGNNSRFEVHVNTVPYGMPAAPNVYNDSLKIGDGFSGDMPGFDIAEFRSYQRQLSTSEIRSLYLDDADNAGYSVVEFHRALDDVQSHLSGSKTLDSSQLTSVKETIATLAPLVRFDFATLQQALGLVEQYEASVGPLFMNDHTTDGFWRVDEPEEGIIANDDVLFARAIITLHQNIVDHAYSDSVPKMCPELLSGRGWQTADFFPGSAPLPDDPEQTFSATINATLPAYWGRPVAFSFDPSLRPTGYYLPPGSIAKVIVPDALINTGFKVIVGAHNADHQEKDIHQRLDRVVTQYDIIEKETYIANPLGGGIYIEVPYLSSLGLVDVQFTGVIEAPIFSLRSFDETSSEEWIRRRTAAAPWADFVTDKFMMQVPSEWIYATDYPKQLMQDWDVAMDATSEFMGYRPEERNKKVLYIQPDLQIRAASYGIGYPQINQLYHPSELAFGRSDNWMLNEPSIDAIEFHELGHAQLPLFFWGEHESIINLIYVYLRNVKLGVDFDEAFMLSSGGVGDYTPEDSTTHWMVTENFRNGREMDNSNSTKDEFRYQHRSWAKYADMVELYSWEMFLAFQRQEHCEYLDDPLLPDFDDDYRILKLSRAAGYDLRPLIHFWGIHPEDPQALAAAMQAEGLELDDAVKDKLMGYMELIPADNAAFNVYFERVWPGTPEGGDPDFGLGWHNVWKDIWDESHAAQARQALQDIVDLYYPQ